GLAKMHIGPFILYTSLGAAIWNSILVGLGAAFHSAMDKEELMAIISKYSHIIGVVAIILVFCIIVFLIYKGTKKQTNANK
nr:DedA family protein [Bacteroidaceae bacterium]